MDRDDFDSLHLARWIELLRAGDSEAPNELVRHVCGRMERLTSKMLQNEPRVRRWEDTGDILQGAFTRLLRALHEVTPGSRREFFALATVQIRRELIDLARRHYGPRGIGANHASVAALDGHNDAVEGAVEGETCDSSSDSASLEEWTTFHEQVAQLPDKEREVFELRYYHGCTNNEIAELVNVDVSTVERRYRSGVIALSRVLRSF